MRRIESLQDTRATLESNVADYRAQRDAEGARATSAERERDALALGACNVAGILDSWLYDLERLPWNAARGSEAGASLLRGYLERGGEVAAWIKESL